MSDSAEVVKPLAMKVLRAASTESVLHLQRRCELGGLNGSKYDECFYGLLAQGAGIVVPDESDFTTSLARVAEYAESIGIELDGYELDPLECFCLHVIPSQTLETCSELAEIARWCDEVLREALVLV